MRHSFKQFFRNELKSENIQVLLQFDAAAFS